MRSRGCAALRQAKFRISGSTNRRHCSKSLWLHYVHARDIDRMARENVPQRDNAVNDRPPGIVIRPEAHKSVVRADIRVKWRLFYIDFEWNRREPSIETHLDIVVGPPFDCAFRGSERSGCLFEKEADPACSSRFRRRYRRGRMKFNHPGIEPAEPLNQIQFSLNATPARISRW